MTASYLLDTNAYYLFFHATKSQSLSNLETKIRDAEGLSFYISEITSLEVHSVLGKYGRGVAPQKNLCDRSVDEGGVVVRCVKQWVTPERKRMKPKVFQGIRKMISDIENERGDIKAEVLRLNSEIILEARNFLYRNADMYNCGSHDAIIAATAIVSSREHGKKLTLVTSDKGFKAALRHDQIPHFDPKELAS